MIALALAVLLAPGAFAQAKPEVKASTGAFVAPQPSTIYTTEKQRDPFSMSGGGAAGGRSFSMDDFSIHNLTLRGMMKDRAADYALFTDNTFGASFILRRGKLYDPKGKPVAGVKGTMDLKKKTAHLETLDSDVQIFRLGDEAID